MVLMLVNENEFRNINCQGNQTNEIPCIFSASYLCHRVKVFIKF